TTICLIGGNALNFLSLRYPPSNQFVAELKGGNPTLATRADSRLGVGERTRSRGRGARRGQRIFDEVMRGSA
ncbi:MAG TPA: hypothetical protein VEQ62_13490, partial [Stellaceae bacterium]|nr:hypothetical protein [Stellaceae bacterium]